MFRYLAIVSGVLAFLALVAVGGAVGILWYYGRGLPDYDQLAVYEPPISTRLHAGDGRLVAEYAIQKRVFVPIAAVPPLVVNAFLASEDKNFYMHSGIDPVGIIRAAVTNVRNAGENKRPVGASTITQQVAKNFLLGNEVSIARKAKEAILAFRIENAYPKDRILELYLNEIYLGLSAYGVAAASQIYFNKSLEELTIGEAAYLAALPKAPNNYHPTRRPEAAKARRDYVVGRMLEDGHITSAQAEAAVKEPLGQAKRAEPEVVGADYYAEEVRREIAQRYGEKALYEGGLSVRSSLDPKLQAIAEKSLREGMVAYDRRHGWRGPIAKVEPGPGVEKRLTQLPHVPGIPNNSMMRWRLVAVTTLEANGAEVVLSDGRKGFIPLAEMTWARAQRADGSLGPAIKQPKDVLEPGFVVAVERIPDEPPPPAQPARPARGKQAQPPAQQAAPPPPKDPRIQFRLRQIPEVGAAVVAMDPHTGRVLAMVGGWSFEISQFNRATQAWRQPGSAFKPFVYATAMDNGFTPASIVLDAPFVLQIEGQPDWKPENYSQKYYGPSTLRTGLALSRNLMTVRLAHTIGMDKVVSTAVRLGVVDRLEPYLPMSLGAGETTVLKMTAAYSTFVNGGKQITPTLIDRVQDRRGRTIFRHDARPCQTCRAAQWDLQPPPRLPDVRAQVLDGATAFQMVSMMEGTVRYGTGSSIAQLGKPLAGKTGTTNDSNDTWFVGFSPDLAVGVYFGFDTPRTLGKRETGASVAVPVFKEFMRQALADKPGRPFRVPPGIRLVRIDQETGLPNVISGKMIFEAFKVTDNPEDQRVVLDSVSIDMSEIPDEGDNIERGSAKARLGGLY
jgi:penicillin-binding protein 1A